MHEDGESGPNGRGGVECCMALFCRDHDTPGIADSESKQIIN